MVGNIQVASKRAYGTGQNIRKFLREYPIQLLNIHSAVNNCTTSPMQDCFIMMPFAVFFQRKQCETSHGTAAAPSL